jgi:hypothetical protein
MAISCTHKWDVPFPPSLAVDDEHHSDAETQSDSADCNTETATHMSVLMALTESDASAKLCIEYPTQLTGQCLAYCQPDSH